MLLDLAAAWSVASARGSPAVLVKGHEYKKLLEAVRFLTGIAAKYREAVSRLAFKSLVVDVAVLYKRVARDGMGGNALEGFLQALWRMIPAARIALPTLDEAKFVKRLTVTKLQILDAGGPKAAARERVAAAFGLKSRQAKTVYARASSASVLPFGVGVNDQQRLQFFFEVFFPDVGAERLAAETLERVLEAGGEDERFKMGAPIAWPNERALRDFARRKPQPWDAGLERLFRSHEGWTRAPADVDDG